MRTVSEKLDNSRRDLLDLGLRNPLLNYRSYRARGVEIIDEKPEQVFDILVSKGRKMDFLPGKEDEDSEEGYAPPEDDGLPEGEVAARHRDTKLQTVYTPKQLHTRLLNSYYLAREHIEEQGVNVLFLALGMLEWYESEDSKELRRAPLILVPVELERQSARTKFFVSWNEEDPGGNLSLQEKMRLEFSITIPSFEDFEEGGVEEYFSAVETAIGAQERWRVDRDAVALSFFSFAKFLMYKDLEPDTWFGNGSVTASPVILSLLEEGFREPPSPFDHVEYLDDLIDPFDSNLVKDADGSQTLAILEVNHGRNLVIQGPPGTGKSQTITNLIAESIGAGKKVLFVAEKMAALEVVKRRLDEIGLGVACLELHSHKSRKKEVLEKLRSTLSLGKPVHSGGEKTAGALRVHRDRLNAYCRAMNTMVGDSGLTPHQILGQLLLLRNKYTDSPLPGLPGKSAHSWTAEDAQRRLGLVQELATRLESCGTPREHRFWGVGLTVLVPTEQQRLLESFTRAAEATLSIRRVGKELAQAIGIDPPGNRKQLVQLINTARELQDFSPVHQFNPSSSDWKQQADKLGRLFDAVERKINLYRQFSSQLIPEAWGQDLLETRQAMASYGQKWWKFLFGTYRRAKAKLSGLCQEKLPKSHDERMLLLDCVLEYQRLWHEIAGLRESIKGALSGNDPNAAENPNLLCQSGRWLFRVHEGVQRGDLPSQFPRALLTSIDTSKVQEVAARAEEQLSAFENRLRETAKNLQFNPSRRFQDEKAFVDRNLDQLDDLFASWEEDFPSVYTLISYNQVVEQLRADGLDWVVDSTEQWSRPATHLPDAVRNAWLIALIKFAYQERQALSTFDGPSHTKTIDSFRESDKLLFHINRAKLALKHWEQLPRTDTTEGQLGVLRREFEKKSRHLPIRRLMEKAGHAIQAIKPVFMMGPMSVASYLPPGSADFDLVVFDEASQVKPVDAFGALMRGRQAVVVGDSKQLPPTSFFDSLVGGETEADDENLTSDLESVLGMFSAQGAPQRMLHWHYRSRHESLIAVSNSEFYDNNLVIFPSPDGKRIERGLFFRHLPHSVYDTGKSRTNREEARIVAEAVIEHSRARPGFTLSLLR